MVSGVVNGLTICDTNMNCLHDYPCFLALQETDNWEVAEMQVENYTVYCWPCATCPTSPGFVRAYCRFTKAKAGQHEPGSPNLLTPTTWLRRLNPLLLFGPAFLGLWQVRFRLCCADSTEPAAGADCCQSDIFDTGATQKAVSALLHAAAGACLFLSALLSLCAN